MKAIRQVKAEHGITHFFAVILGCIYTISLTAEVFTGVALQRCTGSIAVAFIEKVDHIYDGVTKWLIPVSTPHGTRYIGTFEHPLTGEVA